MLQQLRDLSATAKAQQAKEHFGEEKRLDELYKKFVDDFFPNVLYPAIEKAASLSADRHSQLMTDTGYHEVKYRILRFLVNKGLIAQWYENCLEICWS